MTFITVWVEVSCHLRFTLAANSVAHTSQFSDVGLILCWSRIRKFVTHREHTYRQTDRQTEKAITEATLIPWIAGLSGPILLRIYEKTSSQSETIPSPPLPLMEVTIKQESYHDLYTY